MRFVPPSGEANLAFPRYICVLMIQYKKTSCALSSRASGFMDASQDKAPL